uniref:Uncharacterized protein n=1 Tax=Setaria italica TaxID=4555 RepID=K3Y1S5_SETIT
MLVNSFLCTGSNNEGQNGLKGLSEMVADLVIPISVGCHFGVMILGLAFFKDSVFQRYNLREPVRQFQLTEEDVLHAVQAVLPVFPLLLFGAKFGHLLTIQRLLATGMIELETRVKFSNEFFCCFTLPKLYSCYSSQILNAWRSCPRKKLVMTVAVTTFWNLISLKTHILAGMMFIVCLAETTSSY